LYIKSWIYFPSNIIKNKSCIYDQSIALFTFIYSLQHSSHLYIELVCGPINSMVDLHIFFLYENQKDRTNIFRTYFISKSKTSIDFDAQLGFNLPTSPGKQQQLFGLDTLENQSCRTCPCSYDTHNHTKQSNKDLSCVFLIWCLKAFLIASSK